MQGILLKAMGKLKAFVLEHADELELPKELVLRAEEEADRFTSDATAAGILKKAGESKVTPAKIAVRTARSPVSSPPTLCTRC